MNATDFSLPEKQPVSAWPPALWHTHNWVADMVVGLNLCPFARAELVQGRIRYALCEAAHDEAVLQTLETELLLLQGAERSALETTLLVCPQAWGDFLDMQLFLPHADALLKRLGLRGTLQIAHFHPRFVFTGSDEQDAANYSNRSPHPTLHLLREDAISRAAASMAEPDSIYEANIALLQRMGKAAIEARLAAVRRSPQLDF